MSRNDVSASAPDYGITLHHALSPLKEVIAWRELAIDRFMPVWSSHVTGFCFIHAHIIIPLIIGSEQGRRVKPVRVRFLRIDSSMHHSNLNAHEHSEHTYPKGI